MNKHDFEKVLIKISNGNAYLVGGAIRDSFYNKESKDFDYCITGIPIDELEQLLIKSFPESNIDMVGKSFGIIKVNDFDVAIPRKDVDRNHVVTSHEIPIEDDLSRRDFTINAMAVKLDTNELIDPFNGKSDIDNRIIRSVGNSIDRFKEDPLRILRAVQFACRFDLSYTDDLFNSIKKNVTLLRLVSKERFFDEFSKAFSKGDKPRFFEDLNTLGISTKLLNDIDPIISKGNEIIPQFIGMFIRSGDYKTILNSNIHIQLIEVSKYLVHGFPEMKLDNKSHLFPTILQALSKINTDIYIKVSNGLSIPIIPRKSKHEWNSWEVPMMTGEILDYLKENRNVNIKPHAIPSLMKSIIFKYQSHKIKIYDSHEKSIEELKSVLG